VETNVLLEGIRTGDRRMLARAITLAENELQGYEVLMPALPIRREVPVIGITGPPGAGKSTLISSLVREICQGTNANGIPNQVGILAVDPTSPFTHGSLLGDRLRMQEHFNHPGVFIRSLATRGALGGLSAKTVEICDILRSAPFDYIFIETVGVGQSEVEIVSLADTVVVTLVPEAGDEIQALKSGIMEIGDVFVVNKADREGADLFAAGIVKTLHERPGDGHWTIPVIKTVANRGEGISTLLDAVQAHQRVRQHRDVLRLTAERAFRLIQQQRMRGLTVSQLEDALKEPLAREDFNLYRFVKAF
jgi:LAO/AO transport system kinase